MEMMKIRSKYSVHVDEESLSLGYELDNIPRHKRLAFEAISIGTFKRWLLYGGSQRAYTSGSLIIDSIRGVENMAGRQTTQAEAEAFAFHATKRTSYRLWGQTIGVLAGATIAYRTRETMKFPFMQPKPLERYNNYPNRYTPILRGRMAQLAWQITRANIWSFGLMLITAPFFSSMGDTVMMVGLYRDDRTQGLMKEIKGTLDRIVSNRARSSQNQQSGQSTQPQQEGQNDDTFGQFEDDSNSGYVDRKPTTYYAGGRSASYGGEETYTDGTSETGMLSDSAARSQETRQSSSSNYGGGSPYNTPDSIPSSQPYHSQNQSRGGSKDIFFDDDDASPTAGNDADMSTPPLYSRPNTSGGSRGAWARIRSGGTQTSQPTSTESPYPQSRNNDQSNSGNSFSFSNTDAERAYAKEQAQREFDKMLDRERQQSGSDEYDRGMRAVEASQDSRQQGGDGGSVWQRRRAAEAERRG
jgi:hypothetical protein